MPRHRDLLLGDCQDHSRRDRRWLLAYARQTIAPSTRLSHYLRLIADWDAPLDLTDPGPDPEVKQQAYDVSRGGGGLLGRKSFLYATPGSRLHCSPDVLREALHGLRCFVDKQDDQGRFIWGSGHYYQMGTHEHVWRLEPLIWSRLWLQDHVKGSLRSDLDRAIQRAADYLMQVPRIDNSNQGAVWCYGGWLAGLYLNDRRYINAVEQHALGIMNRLVDSQGQVIEASDRYFRGGGPCSNYTYTGWTYIMLYRLLSGRSDLDDRLVQALRWLTLMHTRGGLPLATGASVRMTKPRVAVSDVLHGLEFFAAREPYFSKVVDSWLPEVGRTRMGHAIHPCLWAAKAHRRARLPRTEPAWRQDHERNYETAPIHYFLASHRFQTAVTLRSPLPRYKGLQTFSWGDEPPIIHPSSSRWSTVRCGAVDTGAQNIDAGPVGWEVHYRRKGPADAEQNMAHMTSLTTRRGQVWECFLFTAWSVLYIVSGGGSPTEAAWVLGGFDGKAKLDTRCRLVRQQHGEGCLHYRADSARLVECDGCQVLELSSRTAPLVVGFSNDQLRLERLSPDRQLLRFSDPSGRYDLLYRGMLADDGTLRRWWGNAVKPTASAKGTGR